MADIVVEVPAAKETKILLDSCSSAVSEGHCVVAGTETSVGARAIVRFEGDDATIEVVVEGKPPRTRTIHFAERDPAIERYRAAGLVIATVYGEVVAPPPPPPPPPPAPPPPLPLPLPLPPPPPRTAKLWVDVGPMLGNGLDSNGPRVGPFARVAVLPWSVPIGGAFGISYALRPADGSGLQAQWLTLDLAPRVRLPIGQTFSIEGGAGFALHFVHGSVTQGNLSDQASRWTAGGYADAAFAATFGVIGFVAGIRGEVGQATQIRVLSTDVARDPGLLFAGMLGVRVVLWR